MGLNMTGMTGQMNDKEVSPYSYSYWTPWLTGYGMFNYRFDELISLTTELGYTTIGEETIQVYNEYYPGSRNYDYKWRYNSLQLSPLMKISIDCKWFGCYFLAGPYFLKIFGGRGFYRDDFTEKVYDYEKMGPIVREYVSETVYGYYGTRNYSFGACGGTGIEKKMGSGKVDLDFRFGITLMDMISFQGKNMRKLMKEEGYIPFRNLYCSITLSYWYFTGKEKK